MQYRLKTIIPARLRLIKHNLAVPDRSQASFAFQLNLQIDQPRQTPQHVNQVSKHPQSTGHLEKNCKLLQPVKNSIFKL